MQATLASTPRRIRATVGSSRTAPLEDRLIVALDVPNADQARKMVELLDGAVSFFKIGLQLQFGGGLAFAQDLVAEGKKVFLDAKVHDIEETVRLAVTNIAAMGVHFLTVHGSGETIRAATAARGASDLKIFSVTVLTNLDEDDLRDLGYDVPVNTLVQHRARQAMEAGADGVIASGLEAEDIRQLAGERLLIITPGIRSKGIPHNDQRRVVTPGEAIAAGADYLVVGREILTAANPRDAALRILDQMAAA